VTPCPFGTTPAPIKRVLLSWELTAGLSSHFKTLSFNLLISLFILLPAIDFFANLGKLKTAAMASPITEEYKIRAAIDV
jgi:hypothetical protein